MPPPQTTLRCISVGDSSLCRDAQKRRRERNARSFQPIRGRIKSFTGSIPSCDPPKGRALRHQFFDVTQAQTEAAVPPNSRDDDRRLELAFPEQRRPAGPHRVTLPDPQMQHFHMEPMCARNCSYNVVHVTSPNLSMARTYILVW